jgi:COMPASS component SWD3
MCNHLVSVIDPESLLSGSDPQIQKDILRIIAQYLGDHGYNASKMMILDEMNLKTFEKKEQVLEIKRMKNAIMEGEWAEVDKLCSRPLLKNSKSFLYAVYKQQYLEYIEHHEIQYS